MFSNSPQYEARLRKPFRPPNITMKQIHDAVPKHLLEKDPVRSSAFIVRDILLCTLFFVCATYIGPAARTGLWGLIPITVVWQVQTLKAFLWLSYWWWQGLVFTSFFCIGGSAQNYSKKTKTKKLIWSSASVHFQPTSLAITRYTTTAGAFQLQFILVPFFAWKHSHNAHHKAVGCLERDENYVPYVRSDFKLPPQARARSADYAEVFDDTPIMTLGKLLVMQSCGWWLYLSSNAMGNKDLYPDGTNLMSPLSPVYKKEQRLSIFISDIALVVMSSILYRLTSIYGWQAFVAYYFIPYMLCNHWIVLCTFLHHSDPTLPHYRKEEWTWVRGAIATVDRPVLGWIGRFFFHNVSHDHIAHHLFSHAPFYNQPQITEVLRSVLMEDYNYDPTNSLYALYRSFTECVFIEDEGNIVFYKNADGVAARAVAEDSVKSVPDMEMPTLSSLSSQASVQK
ncbi:hypothetical protein EUX98_g1641 [Antrodiella citrinella]|uniref:Fatty acid desaturase domain-containing protein n=1 Tax=Antrodiella citrinella TaxID=2447956 RepID=A0A4S4N3Z0_9APHY|nr:hypothetical protein EUX98_g1641 [Antrodiella citrinella]